jgi:hypothetical protein
MTLGVGSKLPVGIGTLVNSSTGSQPRITACDCETEGEILYRGE